MVATINPGSPPGQPEPRVRDCSSTLREDPSFPPLRAPRLGWGRRMNRRASRRADFTPPQLPEPYRRPAKGCVDRHDAIVVQTRDL